MSPDRLASDRDRLRALAARSPALVQVLREVGTPAREFHVRLACRGLAGVTAEKPRYRDSHDVVIKLGPHYPLMQPEVVMKTPILHPHVWTHNDHVCLGGWQVTEYLDLLVCRMFRIIQMDPKFINAKSLANHAAYDWVKANRRLLPLGTVDPCAPSAVTAPGIRFTRL